VALAELFVGPGRTTASPDELLMEVRLPAPAEGTGSCYARLEYRRQMEIAIVGATAVVTLDGGAVSDARIAITALAPTIHRVADAESALNGSDGGGLAADLGRPRQRRLPPGDGGRHRTPRHRHRPGTSPRRAVPDPSQPRAARCGQRRSSMRYEATLHVNGAAYPVEIEPGRTLLSVIRTEVGLTGAKEGCDDSECGACMVLLDGQPVNSCSYLALQADGREITTIEGLTGDDGELHPLQQAFLDQGGVQCGFCTPGMLISAKALLDRTPQPSEEEIRLALSGNLCRCTGYSGIVRAVQSVVPS
jgi:aerobic-type carbon monoxide dehydrogenase small subunit (CoxS/CutS family)